MNFLRKHYEKIILASFLLIFILSLIYLITVFSKSSAVTKKDLVLKELKADYPARFDIDGKEITAEDVKEKYSEIANLNNASNWVRTGKKDVKSPVASDLMMPIKAARCPNCKKIIPSIYFEKNEPCILCGGVLKELVEVDPTLHDVDNDGDGMPDAFEKKYGLNHKLAADKMEDLDEDGFPNYIEFKAKTKINDPKSHPSIVERLALRGVKKTKLPIQLWNVLSHGKEDKSEWLIQIKIVNKRKKWISRFPKLGSIIKLNREKYKIIDVNYTIKEKFDKKLGAPKSTNISTITLEKVGHEKDVPIIVEMKKNVYENLAKIRLTDMFNRKSYNIKIGDQLTIGSSRVGLEKIRLLSLSKNQKSVIVKGEAKESKEVIVGRKSELDRQIDQINKEDNKERVDSKKKRRRNPMQEMNPFEMNLK